MSYANVIIKQLICLWAWYVYDIDCVLFLAHQTSWNVQPKGWWAEHDDLPLAVPQCSSQTWSSSSTKTQPVTRSRIWPRYWRRRLRLSCKQQLARHVVIKLLIHSSYSVSWSPNFWTYFQRFFNTAFISILNLLCRAYKPDNLALAARSCCLIE